MSDSVRPIFVAPDELEDAIRWRDKEIDRLRAEVAEAKASQRGDDEEREELHEKIADLRAREITDEQIDAAWTRANVRSLRIGQPQNDGLESLAEMGIVECPNCWDGGRFDALPEDCPCCHGHGWIREERGDE